MLKETQMCIKMESELHRDFITASKEAHRPAAQIVRDLIRAYLTQRKRKPVFKAWSFEFYTRLVNLRKKWKWLNVEEKTL